jgi:hypothetical protein
MPMNYLVKKTKASSLPSTLQYRAREENNFLTIEVVSLKDMPIRERRREANKPLYLKKFE